MPKLLSTRILFLSPDTTSRIQQCDASTIVATKMRYRKYQLERALDLQDADVADIYKEDILSAMFV